jgi:hypothetical protein
LHCCSLLHAAFGCGRLTRHSYKARIGNVGPKSACGRLPRE